MKKYQGEEITETHYRRHVQKMELLGILLGDVIHDINNQSLLMSGILGIITQSSNLKKEEINYLDQLSGAIEHLTLLGEKLSPYICTKPVTQSFFNAGDAIKKLEPHIISIVGRKRHVVIECKTTRQVYVNESVFNIAILDLIERTSVDEVCTDSLLRLTVVDALSDEIVDAGYYPDQDFLKIEVIDTALEIPADHIAQVFSDPFFVPVKDSKAREMDISLVHTFVMLSNGNISCFSSKECGTIFRILLPVPDCNTYSN